MSFYLGNGASGKLMHITKGSYSSNSMQSSTPLSDTVFHSELGYITYTLYQQIGISSTFALAPTSFFTEIVTNKKLYFVIKKISDLWYQHLDVAVNAPSNILWYTNPAGSLSYYPSISYPWANLQATIEDVYFIVVNINQSGYIPVVKPSNEIILRNGDIVVNGVDLFDLKYIQSSVLNNEDISFNTNSGQFQLVNSILSPSGQMSILSNTTKTEIFNGTKAIFSTVPTRNKVFFNQLLTTIVPYGAVTTSSSGVWYVTVLDVGTLQEGDMFFAKYYADGNTGNDFEASANMMLRYINGDIVAYAYGNHPYGYYNYTDTFVGSTDGSLKVKLAINIYGDGTLVSKRWDFTFYTLK